MLNFYKPWILILKREHFSQNSLANYFGGQFILNINQWSSLINK